MRCYKALLDEHTAWLQRLHATLFHHGVAAERNLLAGDRRQRLERGSGLSPAAHQLVTVALGTLDHLDIELDRLRVELVSFAHRQVGCQALDALYGIGPLTAVAIWAELGDVHRFSSSRHAVRHSGLDVTVYSSNRKRAPGHLARQGPPVLRWALFEAAKCAARAASPDHAYYTQVKGRLGGNRATLSVARKLARRCYHTLAALGEQAFAPPSDIPQLGQVASAMRPVRALPTPLMHRGLLPQVSCRHPRLAGPERTSGRTLWATPSIITSPGHLPADQDKAGRPRTPATAPPPTARLGVVWMR